MTAPNIIRTDVLHRSEAGCPVLVAVKPLWTLQLSYVVFVFYKKARVVSFEETSLK